MLRKFVGSFISTMVAVILVFAICVTVMNHEIQEAEAEEQVKFQVLVTKNTEYGYIPKDDFNISKPSLKAYLRMAWWEASWLDDGDLLISIEADPDIRWFVKLYANDPVIAEIKEMCTNFGLKCAIPDR